MNILQIIDERWDSGITNYALTLSRGLKKHRHNVIVVGLEDKPPMIQAHKMYLNVRFIGSRLDIFDLVSIIRKEKIELINTHTGTSHFLGVIASMILGNKIPVITTRGDIRPPKADILSKFLYTKTDKFITVADFIKDMYKKIGVPDEKLVTIYQGTNLDRFPMEKRLTSSVFSESSTGKRVGIVGRLDPVKDHFGFLRAVSEVKKRIDNIEVLIVGKEENIKQIELQNLARELGIQKNILFAGYTLNVPEIMANCDIGVISSVGSEAISRVLLEWMASAKPVVATRVGIIPEIVQDGVTGFLVGPDSPHQMADKIVSILQDEGKLKNMGIAARKLIEVEFNEEIFIKNTERIYIEALKNKKI